LLTSQVYCQTPHCPRAPLTRFPKKSGGHHAGKLIWPGAANVETKQIHQESCCQKYPCPGENPQKKNFNVSRSFVPLALFHLSAFIMLVLFWKTTPTQKVY
jgi:hypothetical protein